MIPAIPVKYLPSAALVISLRMVAGLTSTLSNIPACQVASSVSSTSVLAHPITKELTPNCKYRAKVLRLLVAPHCEVDV